MVNLLASRLERATQHAIAQEEHRLKGYLIRIGHSAQRYAIQEQNKLQMWNKTIELQSPERIFKMGYSLTMVNGKALMKIGDVKKGDIMKTYVQDGIVESVVK
jgi:exodeoxyribonuclease VII large subunit